MTFQKNVNRSLQMPSRLMLALFLLIAGAASAQKNEFSLQFNGASNFISLPASGAFNFAGNSVLTVEALCNYSGSSANSSIFGKNFSAIGTAQYSLYIDGKTQKIVYAQDDFTVRGWQTVVTSGNAVPKNTWFHVALVKTATTVSIYINGNLEGSGTLDAPRQGSRASSGATYIAKSQLGASFAGQLDDIRIWNTALSDNTIREWRKRNLKPSHPNKANLLAWFRLEEGSGSNLGDSGPAVRGDGSALNASTQGNPTWVSRKSEKEDDDDNDREKGKKEGRDKN